MIVPIGTFRISAHSWYESSPRCYQQEDRALFVGQMIERMFHRVIDETGIELLPIGGRKRSDTRIGGRRCDNIVLGEVRIDRTALRGAAIVQEQIRQNLEDPRLEIGADGEAVEVLPGAQECFLNHVFGSGRLSHQPQRGDIEPIQKRKGEGFELLPSHRFVVSRPRRRNLLGATRLACWEARQTIGGWGVIHD